LVKRIDIAVFGALNMGHGDKKKEHATSLVDFNGTGTGLYGTQLLLLGKF
jgi:hypothetical protein